MKRFRLHARLATRIEMRKARHEGDHEQVALLRATLRDDDLLDAAVVKLEQLIGRHNVEKALGDGTLFQKFLDEWPEIIAFLKELFALIGGLG